LSFSFFLLYLSLYSFLESFLSYVLPPFHFFCSLFLFFYYIIIFPSFLFLLSSCVFVSFIWIQLPSRYFIITLWTKNNFKLLATEETIALDIAKTPQMLGVIQTELPRICALYWYRPSDGNELSERITRAFRRQSGFHIKRINWILADMKAREPSVLPITSLH
jgi:hypothetical protein